MAETKEKKGFNAALYAVVAGIVVAVALVLITIFAFTTRYTGFSNEKVAQAYVDTIVQTGDGYNAYKNTKTCGVIEEDTAYGIKKIAEPIGLIAAVIPTTNPTSTAIFKTLIALKTRNAIIISPEF